MLLFFLKVFEILSLFLFIVTLIISVREIFKDEVLDIRKTFRDFFIATGILLIFIIIGNNNLEFYLWLYAVLIGLAVGFATGYIIKLYYRESQFFTKGNFIYFLVWAIILWLNGVVSSAFSNLGWFWIFLSVVSLVSPLGSEIAYHFRKKTIKAQ